MPKACTSPVPVFSNKFAYVRYIVVVRWILHLPMVDIKLTNGGSHDTAILVSFHDFLWCHKMWRYLPGVSTPEKKKRTPEEVKAYYKTYD